MRYCDCRHHQAGRSRAGATVLLVLALALAAMYVAGCSVTDDQVRQAATTTQGKLDALQRQVDTARAVAAPTTQAVAVAQAEVDTLEASLGPSDPQVLAAKAALAKLRTGAAQLTGTIDRAAAVVAAGSNVLAQVQAHPDQAPDLSLLSAAAAPIPYAGLAIAVIGLGSALIQGVRRSQTAQQLATTSAELDDHKKALAEIVPAVDDLRKAVPPENLNLWKQQTLADFSDSTKALVAANKG